MYSVQSPTGKAVANHHGDDILRTTNTASRQPTALRNAAADILVGTVHAFVNTQKPKEQGDWNQ